RKWSPPSKVFAALGVVFAFAAFVLVRGYSARARGLDAELGDPVSVAAAARGLARGTALDASMLQVRSVPAAFAPPGSVHDPGASGLQVLRMLPSGSSTLPNLGTSPSNSAAGVLLMLLSTPDQAEQLAYAQAFADISVTLEGPEEVVPPEGP